MEHLLSTEHFPATDMPRLSMPTLGTVPLGPDEPELFTNAMQRILETLGADDQPGGGRPTR
jgi:hypothetical protein